MAGKVDCVACGATRSVSFSRRLSDSVFDVTDNVAPAADAGVANTKSQARSKGTGIAYGTGCKAPRPYDSTFRR